MTGRSAYAIPARLNVAVMAAQLLGVLGCFCAAARTDRWWQLALLAAAFAVLMNSVYAVIHEAQHGMLLPSRRANDFAGMLMSVFFPAPFHLIRQGHIGHHLRNRSDDEAFDFYFDGEHPVWKHLQLYGILTGCFYVVLLMTNVLAVLFPFVLRRRGSGRRVLEFDRPSAALVDGLNPQHHWLVAVEGLVNIAAHVAIVRALHIPVVNYAVMYAGFGFTWSAMQYVHHFGTERDVVKGALNLRLWAPLDLLWMNHNWHQTHHQHPTVPWTYLPSLGRAENPERGFLPWAYLRMWRGPRYTDEHVENRYAGRVIQ